MGYGSVGMLEHGMGYGSVGMLEHRIWGMEV